VATVDLYFNEPTSSLTITYSPGSGGAPTVSQIALVEQMNTDRYDAFGNLISETDFMGNTTTYVYSSLNLPAQQSVNSGPMLGPLYDKAGNVLSDTDLQNGYATDYKYDMFGHLVETDQPNNVPNSGYYGQPTDGNGNPVGPVTTFSYDADGNLLSQSLPNPTTGAAGGPTTS